MDVNVMLHSVSAVAKGPVLWLLVILLILTAGLLGSVLGEVILRRKKRTNVDVFIKTINEKKISELSDAINSAGFTNAQKSAFLGVINTDGLSENMRTEVAQGWITKVEDHYSKIINNSELIVKIAPMAGLMGTLIPLGPGIMALGHGDMETLSESLITAFDTTVAGLISAGCATVISSIRKIWYKKYIADTEAIIEALLEKLSVQEVV